LDLVESMDRGDDRGRRWARALPLLGLCLLPGCFGEVGALAAFAFTMTMSALLMGRERHRRALLEAETLRRAIASGNHRDIEFQLRRELALAAAGETTSVERIWLARAQLGALLVAEWRLDEAAEVYAQAGPGLSPHLQALAAFGRHELAVLREEVHGARVTAITRDRDACLGHVPEPYRPAVARAWGALEGLALVRLGRVREGIDLLERGRDSVSFNPARIVYVFHLAQAYEQIGDRPAALARYSEAMVAFPGTRLASEARVRIAAIRGEDSLFRGMLPEAPAPSTYPANGPTHAATSRPAVG
jgi:tetratricopeptide (TPR) repeat protein